MIEWPIRWRYGDRIFVTGPPGSGKTTVLKSLFKQRGNGLLIDTKHDPDDGFDEVGVPVETRQMRHIRQGRFIWNAGHEFILDQETQSKFFFAALESGPRALAIDEGYNLLKSQGEKLFVTQCRGKKVAFLILAQRPSGLSLHIVFSANFYIVFYLPNEDDRTRIEKAVGDENIPWEKLQQVKHSFMVYNDRGDSGGPFKLKL